MDDLFIRRPRRQPLELNLTPMIDIFSMLVIFLILGAMHGQSGMELPASLLLPESNSKESAELAPQLILTPERVEFRPLGIALPASAFENASDGSVAEIENLKSRLAEYTKTLPASVTGAGLLLNVISDKNMPYRKLYNILGVFRESGFETLLFVTQPERKSE